MLDAIYLRPTRNMQSGHDVMNVTTGWLISRAIMHPILMTQATNDWVNDLGIQQKWMGLKFKNHDGVILPDTDQIAGVADNNNGKTNNPKTKSDNETDNNDNDNDSDTATSINGEEMPDSQYKYNLAYPVTAENVQEEVQPDSEINFIKTTWIRMTKAMTTTKSKKNKAQEGKQHEVVR